MTRARFVFLVAAASAAVLAAHGANATSLDRARTALRLSAAGSSLVQEIHGCHYTCECGPLEDFGCEQVYHRHLHMLCLPVRCKGGPPCDRTPPDGVCRHITPPN